MNPADQYHLDAARRLKAEFLEKSAEIRKLVEKYKGSSHPLATRLGEWKGLSVEGWREDFPRVAWPRNGVLNFAHYSDAEDFVVALFEYQVARVKLVDSLVLVHPRFRWDLRHGIDPEDLAI